MFECRGIDYTTVTLSALVEALVPSTLTDRSRTSHFWAGTR
jgi:hypothetical protein